MTTVQWEMIEAGGRAAQSFGFSRLSGQIFMLLYMSEEPLSLDQITQQLEVSKASVSIVCRQLTTWGALRLVWKKGDRKDYYAAENNLHRLLGEGLVPALRKKLDSAGVQIERCLVLLNQAEEGQSNVEHVRGRLQQASKYRARMEQLLDNSLIRMLAGF